MTDRVVALEKRVAALEVEVAEIKRRLAEESRSQEPWWHRISGAFGNEPAFDDPMRLGREYRASLRPKSKRRRSVRQEQRD